MKRKIQYYFALSESGSQNILRAAVWSFLKYLSFIFPMMLVLWFLQDLLSESLKPWYIYMGMLGVVAVVMYTILYREYTLTYDVTYQESVALRIQLANQLKALPLAYFSKHSIADLSQTIMMDVNNIETAISHAIPQGIGFAGFFGLMTLIMIVNNPLLGLMVTLPIWLAIGFLFLTHDYQTRAVSKYYQHLLENAGAFQDAFEMQQEIKSYGMQEKFRQEISQKLYDTERMHIKAEFTMAITSAVFGIIPYLSPVLTAIGGAFLFKAGQLSVLYYIGYLMAATNIAAQYSSVSEFVLTMFYFGDSFKRIRELNQEPIQEGTLATTNQFDIQLHNVQFSYGNHQVIKEVSFTAQQGQVTALVGPSGCGKTTILRLISRLYDYDEGLITLGGQDIKKIKVEDLFDKVSIVFQNIDLFNMSVLENIRMGRKDATDEEVYQVARLANVEEIVNKLPEGYQTIIGENGARLSGGERQRISIARALLKDAPIILLDEIAASIDVVNEMAIQRSLSHLIQGKTVITISHRLKSVEKADKIIVMDKGTVECQGTHASLMNDSALYRLLVEKSSLTDQYIY